MVICCSAGDGRVSLLVEMAGYSSSNSPPFSVTRQCLTIAQVTPLTSASCQVPPQNLSAVTWSSVMHKGHAVGTARLVCCGLTNCSVRTSSWWLLQRASTSFAVCAAGCSLRHTVCAQKSFSEIPQHLTTSTYFAELLPGSGGFHCRHDASLLLLAALQRCVVQLSSPGPGLIGPRDAAQQHSRST